MRRLLSLRPAAGSFAPLAMLRPLLAALSFAALTPVAPEAQEAPGDGGARPAERRLTVFDYRTELPLSGVEITMRARGDTVAPPVRWTTGFDGTVTLAATRSGEYTVEMRRLGHRPGLVTVRLAPNDSLPVHVKLEDAAIALATVVTTGERVPPKLLDFYTRRSMSIAPPSSFITPEEIARRRPQVASDMLRDRGPRAWACRNGPIFVDGVLLATHGDPGRGARASYNTGRIAASLLDDIAIEQIRAIEVYVGANQIPIEFNRSAGVGGPMGCAVLVWLR